MDKWLNIDDSDAIFNIRKQLPEELAQQLTDEEIEEVIDGIHDYLFEHGLLEEDSEDEAIEIDVDELAGHVSHKLKTETKEKITDSLLKLIIQAELDYSDFL